MQYVLWNEPTLKWLFWLVWLYIISVDIHESAMEAFLALIRYNEFKNQKVTVTYVSIIRYSRGKKHVEGFPEQFFKCLRRYVGKHAAP